MPTLLFAFWNKDEQRLRAFWRLLLFLLFSAAATYPFVALVDATDNKLVEATFKNLVVALGFCGALAICARLFEKRSMKHFGLTLQPRWFGELGVGVVLGGTIMALAVVPQYIAGWITIDITLHTSIPATPFLLAFGGQVVRYLSGSFFEELFSRGYLLRVIAEGIRSARIQPRHAAIIAAVATSLLFGVLHIFNQGSSLVSVLNLTALGLLFAVPMLVTGRLGASIGLHIGWNVFQNIVFGLPNSGKPSNTSILSISNTGPELWTGGSFGPEGGLLAFIAILTGFVLIGSWLKYCRNSLNIDTSFTEPAGTSYPLASSL